MLIFKNVLLFSYTYDKYKMCYIFRKYIYEQIPLLYTKKSSDTSIDHKSKNCLAKSSKFVSLIWYD
jgi:hypothetical protein